ncbi:MAG: histidinol-phosphatase HisJ [Armatimonadetes bacterium]|nr:histidinol-phosphatase HisJ [Armatimonadota bacterium]
MLDLAIDGHTHSPFCPHGSPRPLDEYFARAVELGLERYAVTEHIALPHGFVDPMGPRECAMLPEEMTAYLDDADAARERFPGPLTIYVGFEVDYLGAAQGGWHGELLRMLHGVWGRVDPEATVLSLHFVDRTVVDGTAAMAAAELVSPSGTSDGYHLRYYRLLASAVNASWRYRGVDLRPRRLGHLTLPTKFVRTLPLAEPERVLDAATRVLELAVREGLEIDCNTAGLDKPECGETYLPEPLLSRALELGAQVVFGSDAHAPEEVGRYRERLSTGVSNTEDTESTEDSTG